MSFFRVPTRIDLSPGSSVFLGETARDFDLERVLLVTDPGLEETPLPNEARERLEEEGVAVTSFTDVEPNPRTVTVERMAEILRREDLQGVVAMGGGSVLDAGKAAAMLATNKGGVARYEGRNRYENPPLPMIAVPTTCGTGSEVTWVAVLTDRENRRKISVKGDTMFPTAAVVDAELLETLPGPLVAATGFDALTHALEAMTCSDGNQISDALAEAAVDFILRFLERAVADISGDPEARAAMATASTLAGLAFGNADVAAVHCLSEALGGLYDVPHGLANAVLLVPVLRSHGSSVRRRLAALDDLVHPEQAGLPEDERAAHLLETIEDLARRVGIPGFDALGADPKDFRHLAAAAARNGSNHSNPRPMYESDYLEILESLAGG